MKGFTLIEMLLYIGLLGMLMSMLIVSAYSFLGQNTLLQNRAEALEDILLTHYNDYKK